MRADRAGIGFPIGQTVAEVEILEKYAKLKPKKTITIEIGTRNGGTTIILATNTFDPVVTIDIVPPLPKHWARWPGGSRIEQVTAVSWDVDWDLEPRPVGLVFIDGSHEYEDVVKDWKHFYPHVVPGGYCLLHDYQKFPGVTRFVDEDLSVEPIDRGGYILVFQRENNSHDEENQG
jgi:cephalosporin hydroxylase